MQKPETKLWLEILVENFSKEETSGLKTDLSFELKTKVVGDFKVYNFHEENFSKFGVDLQERDQTLGTDFKPGFENIRVFTKIQKEVEFWDL